MVGVTVESPPEAETAEGVDYCTMCGCGLVEGCNPAEDRPVCPECHTEA
jgi:hypothetical protein